MVDAAAATGQTLHDDAAAERLHVRGVGDLPIDPHRAVVELSEEQRALRSSRPKNRRWRSLEKLDTEVDRAAQRVDEARRRLSEAEEQLRGAPETDAATLAEWIASGERGERPEPTLYERQRDVDAARLLVEAATLELDRALERRLEHVERNRRKMLEDARKDPCRFASSTSALSGS